MVPDYRWWESEIDYSRLYMAGHVVSDLKGGVVLGDMVGEYFARTRGAASSATGPAAGSKAQAAALTAAN
jgi:hypothetical protein